MAGLETRRVTDPGMQLAFLKESSIAEGFGMMSELLRAWEKGANRFDLPGEILLMVCEGPDAIAVGGLNIDPYTDEPGIGRIRHVYVALQARGTGVGAGLVSILVEHGRKSFHRVRLRTVTEDGSRFYEALGFDQTDEANATHSLELKG